MITWLSLVCASLAVFLAYNITVLCIFGVPSSLSNTYYLYEAKKKHLGLVFPAMMSSMAFTLLPAWLELGEMVSLWSAYLNPLAFFACAAILFVGGAPAFRSNKLEGTVHEVAAIVAAACAVVWCLVVCWKIMYVPLGIAVLIALGGVFTKTWKTASVYWLEMMAFGATFATVITQFLILL
jgi:hypothetical protein